MGGYFTDGETHVELGEHVFLTPVARRANALLSPPNRPGVLLDGGGGVVELTVTGQRLRHNLGDAERYVYGLFRALALSGAGDLGVEDELGSRSVFGDCLCVEAAAEVRAMRFVEMRFTFAAPERVSQPAWAGVPAAPGEYPRTDSLQDYAAGGVAVGAHPVGVRIEMTRQCQVRPLPRARGARVVPVQRGAVLTFAVQAHTSTPGSHLAAHLEELTRSIGPRPVTLTGNGNAFGGAALEGVEPVHTDGHHTRLEARFLLPLAADAPTTQAPTTSTTAEPTTTAAACPDQAHCTAECAQYYYCDDFAGMLCGGGVGCSGSMTWVRDGADACKWVMYSPAGCCSAAALQCSAGAWSFMVTHSIAGKTAIYGKPNAPGGCPAGVYALTGGTCPDAPITVTLYGN